MEIIFDGSAYYIGDIELRITGKKTATIKTQEITQRIKGENYKDLLYKIGRELVDNHQVKAMTVFSLYNVLPMK